MITDQQRLILMIKTSHATKAWSHATNVSLHASQNIEDPQENE